MPKQEVNSLLLRAISDEGVRKELLDNPAAAGKKYGLSEASIQELSRISPASLQAQFDKLTSITRDLGGALEAGYSRDFTDGNVHNKDDHVHDKMGHGAFADPLINVANPAIDKATLEAALKDPIVLREFRSSERLRTLARNVLGRDI